MTFSKKFLLECKEVIKNIDDSNIEKIVDSILKSKNKNGRLFIIGSGGGAGHASHAVCDFRKLCNIDAYAPYDNVSELTARVNDEGWDTTLINWLKVSNFNSKDCILVFSVGGGSSEKNISMNIVNVIKYANEINANITGIVGKDGGFTAKNTESCLTVPVVNNDHITPLTEGFQALIWHLIVSHPKLKENSTKWESVN